MREHSERILKIVCGVLALLLLVKMALAVVRCNPLSGVRIPALPSLAGATNMISTNAASTNKVVGRDSTNKTTNATAPNLRLSSANASSTNAILTNASLAGASSTYASVTNRLAMNAATNVIAPDQTSKAGTNAMDPPKGGNLAGAGASQTNKAGTNVSVLASQEKGTNAIRRAVSNVVRPDMTSMGGSLMGGMSSMKKVELSPLVQSRVDRIIESEILGPIMRPMPMALLGIAGDSVILRAPSGQTGLVKEGAELGGVKILQIGTNRVLVEQDGQKKELMIFSGFGGETLMPKQPENSK